MGKPYCVESCGQQLAGRQNSQPCTRKRAAVCSGQIGTCALHQANTPKWLTSKALPLSPEVLLCRLACPLPLETSQCQRAELQKLGRLCLVCRVLQVSELTSCLQQQKPQKSKGAKRACRWPRHSCVHRQAELVEHVFAKKNWLANSHTEARSKQEGPKGLAPERCCIGHTHLVRRLWSSRL